MRQLIVLIAAAGTIASIPGTAVAQFKFGVLGGVALGKRDVERYDYVDPTSGFPSTYQYYPDSAAHPQGGFAVQALGKFGGLRLSAVYMTAGVVDVFKDGVRACVNEVTGQPCTHDEMNRYPGSKTKYVATDLDLILRGWQADPERVPVDLYILAGPGLRRRLYDPKVVNGYEAEDRWTGTLSFGGGMHVAFPRQDGETIFLIEFRHSTGLKGNGQATSVGSASLKPPNREAKNVLRFGVMF